MNDIVKTGGIRELMKSEYVKKRFEDVLNKRANSFIASVITVTSSGLLSSAEPMSVLSSAMVAATLDLPINPNLGFAYIVPYTNNTKKQVVDENGKSIVLWEKKVVAQFQMGWKGFVQLAMRSGAFKTLNASNVREGELKQYNRLTGEVTFSDDFINGSQEYWEKRDSLPIIGYVSYFKLLNGFEKTLYMTNKEMSSHGSKYSQSFKKGYGLWKDDFEAMALKTIIKLILSKAAPLSTEMQKALESDQAVIREDGTPEYVDNGPLDAQGVARDKERVRVIRHIESSQTIEELEQCLDAIPDGDKELETMFSTRKNELLETQDVQEEA